MSGLGGRLRRWLGAPPPQDRPPAVPGGSTPAAETALHELAAGLEDGAPCPPPVLAALAALVAGRRRATELLDGPTSPALSGLVVRRSGLPDWWSESGGLLLLGPDAPAPDLRTNVHLPIPRRCTVVMGARSRFNHMNLGGEGPLVVLGDDVSAHNGAISCLGASSILIGEGTTCTNWTLLDSRNGGMILTGPDGMWAHGATLMTDDTHAIRDAATGVRLNAFGGRVSVERHVWLCEHARVLDGARIGADCVIGANALVKQGAIPANTVAVGIPARPVRSGVTWSREDRP